MSLRRRCSTASKTSALPNYEPDERALELIRALRRGDKPATEIDRLNRARREDFEQDIKLKRFYGFGLPFIMTAQVLIADVGFFLYAHYGVEWKVEASVMHVWLAATVIEVIAVVLVVTQYLFPKR